MKICPLPNLPPPEFAVKTELPDSRSRVRAVLGALFLTLALTACGGGGSGSVNMAPSGSNTATSLLDLSPANTGYAASAIAKVADSRPRAGSVTQSSNAINNVTQDRVSVIATHGAGRNSYSVRNGSEWSISTSDGNPVSIPDVPAPFKGSELYKRTNGGTLYVDVYSDIEAPTTRQVSVPGASGPPVEIQVGDSITGLTLAEINARMGDGALNGTPGIFSCDRSGGGDCPSFFGSFPVGTDWRFTPHGSGSTRTEPTPDTDYLAGGVWLFIPDSATSVDDVVFGAFADGSDPFRQSNLMALTGTAHYGGKAAGIASGSGIAYFEADVSLRANFGGASDLGTISGQMDGFVVDGSPDDGALDLGAANIGSSNSGFFRGSITSSNTDTGKWNGQWGGQFFGNGGADGKPGSVAGTFGASTGELAIVGAFGAHKQP